MENNADAPHILWKSPDQQTEVWMQQASGKTPEEKKKQSRAGYRLLAEMAKTIYGYELEKERDPVMRTENGKPCLRLHPELFFSISHSGEWVACALGKIPVGMDIQYHRKIELEKTAQKICTPEEWKFFQQVATEQEKEALFFQIWTKKESYLKYTGEGIRRALCGISYEGCCFYRLPMPERYSGMICVENRIPEEKGTQVNT